MFGFFLRDFQTCEKNLTTVFFFWFNFLILFSLTKNRFHNLINKLDNQPKKKKISRGVNFLKEIRHLFHTQSSSLSLISILMTFSLIYNPKQKIRCIKYLLNIHESVFLQVIFKKFQRSI